MMIADTTNRSQHLSHFVRITSVLATFSVGNRIFFDRLENTECEEVR
jgi:hypothetical protein